MTTHDAEKSIAEMRNARKSADDLLASLRDANKYGSATESIILLPMIRRAAELLTDMTLLLNAIESDKEGESNA